jgi:hypothetical protein
MIIKIARTGVVVGEYPYSSIPDLIRDGFVLRTDHYWSEGMEQWESVSANPAWRSVARLPGAGVRRPQPIIPKRSKNSEIPLILKVLGVLALIGLRAGIIGGRAGLSSYDQRSNKDEYAHSINLLKSLFSHSPSAQFPDYREGASDVRLRRMSDRQADLVIVDSWVSLMASDGERGRLDWSITYVISDDRRYQEIVYARLGSEVVKGSEDDRDAMIQIAEQGQLGEITTVVRNYNRRAGR